MKGTEQGDLGGPSHPDSPSATLEGTQAPQAPHFLHEPSPLYLPDRPHASWPLSLPFPGPLLFTLPAPFPLFPFETSLLLVFAPISPPTPFPSALASYSYVFTHFPASQSAAAVVRAGR